MAVLAAWGAVVGVAMAPAALADTTGQHITRYDAEVTLGADGLAQVELDFDVDFGDEPGHGPYLTLPTRQSYDDEQDRLFDVSGISARSESAPDAVNREDTDNAIILRIGDPDVDDVSGVHTYTVSYTVDGWINPDSTTGAGDQLYWNVIGPDWEIPLADLTATVTGPADVTGLGCFAGPHGSTALCDSESATGATATFAQDSIEVGEEFTAVTGWPAGTFPGVDLILGDTVSVLDPVTPTPLTGGVALLVVAGGTAAAVTRVRRTGRDRAYLGLTPGLTPAPGQDGATGYRGRAPVAVQFTPPTDALPGELGTLLDETADPRDVTATIIDLAVRGYLTIREVPPARVGGKVKDWELLALKGDTRVLSAFEVTLLQEIFDDRDVVTLSGLRTTFASSMSRVQDSLYDRVIEKSWFTRNPKLVRASWWGAGFILVVLGAFGTFAATQVDVKGLALLGIAVVLVGLLVAALGKAAPARTPAGTAVLAEAVGFRRYLTTAEAGQIRFEEGQDLFSRYLPYAIVFGVAERWAEIFGDLAAQGRDVPEPGWYLGSSFHSGAFWGSYAAFGSSIENFTSIATSSLSAPTPGSSGGSGFSGGGFSGGGVGGGGGGGW